MKSLAVARRCMLIKARGMRAEEMAIPTLTEVGTPEGRTDSAEEPAGGATDFLVLEAMVTLFM